MHPEIYYAFLNRLKQEYDYISFCNSPTNLKLLNDVNCPIGVYEDESFANFFTFNPDTKDIPFAFFYRINMKDDNIVLPKTQLNQQKYFDILFEMVKLLMHP